MQTYSSPKFEKKDVDKYEIIMIEATQSCNLNCKYCYYNNSKKNTRSKEYINFESFLTLKNKHFYITGGEPFLHNKLLNFINDSYENHNKISIFTNGTLLKNIELDFLKKIHRLYVSIDSFDNVVNDNARGLSPDINLLMKINKLDNDILFLKPTINKQNFSLFNTYITDMIKYKFKNISLNFASIPCDSQIYSEYALINRRETILHIKDVLNRYSNKIFYEKIFFNLYDEFLYKNNFFPKDCPANRSKLCYIDCNGELNKCPNGNFSKTCCKINTLDNIDADSIEQCIAYLEVAI